MKKLSIKLSILRTDLTKVVNQQSDKCVSFPDIVTSESEFTQKYSSNLVKYQLRGVTSCNIMESVDNLTQTATFTLPQKNTSLYRDSIDDNGNFIKGHLLFKDGTKLYTGTQVIIDMGYDDHFQTRFIGYIKDFIEQSPEILISLEDSMYKLKNTISMRTSFPKLVDNGNGGTEAFNLTHLNKWIVSKLSRAADANPSIFVPKIRCYNTDLGKLLIKDPITPAEIYSYYFKDIYGMSIFFRNEYVYKGNIIRGEFFYLMEPVLYIGWKNWDNLSYNEIRTDGLNTIVNDPVIATDYSRIFKFMYPYNDSYSGEYNPIVENNLEWYNSDKDNIKITATGFNSSTHNKIVVVYQYGEYNIIEGKIANPTPITTSEEILNFTPKQLKEYEKQLDEAKKLKEQLELDALTTSVIADSNNLQVFNEMK